MEQSSKNKPPFLTHRYRAYGLNLLSNAPIPGLSNERANIHKPDIILELGSEPSSVASGNHRLASFAQRGTFAIPENGDPALKLSALGSEEFFELAYGDGTRFIVDRAAQQIWGTCPSPLTIEDLATYLLGPVLGFVLRLRGVTCLHASAVAVNNFAIAFVGLPGAGKSTIAAAFARRGFPVLSDDVVALVDDGGRFLVQLGYPRLNLWPDSVRALFGSEDALPRITPTWGKRYMALGENGTQYASQALPLQAIYILGAREAALAAPVVEELAEGEAFMKLVANTYANCLLDRNMRRQEFDVLSRVLAGVRIRRVRPTADPLALVSTCESIAADATDESGVAEPIVAPRHL
jgi:hypothetical protein